MSIRDILQNAYKLLSNQLEARILLSYAVGYSQEYLIGHGEEELSPDKIELFQKLLQRRMNKEPIAYIIGSREFYGRDFIVDKNVLIPRGDSEVLIDAVCAASSSSSSSEGLTILELGVGSGCLILTLLQEMPNANGVGVDISQEALEVAAKNMLEAGLSDRCKLHQSNWFENIEGKYDIIISNPPYISENDKAIMAEETLLYEPEAALYAGNNGYEAYEIIASKLHDFLKPKGKLYLEIGINQEALVGQIFSQAGYDVAEQYMDLAGIVRVLKVERVVITTHRFARPR